MKKMTDILELFSGIGVIIDDAFENGNNQDLIWKIKKVFDEKSIPVLIYSDLPNNEINHLHNCSFILIDWELITISDDEIIEGVKTGASLKEGKRKEVLEFLAKLKNITFLPVFIFSNTDPETIKTELIEKGLYSSDNKSNYIFICRKQDLFDDKSDESNVSTFFDKIKKWLEETPSIYVLKEWEFSLKKAKRDLFWDFYDIHPEWCCALKKSFAEDGAYPDYELGSFLYKNLSARSSSIIFDEQIVKGDKFKIEKSDLRKVLEGERFLKKELPDMPYTGDVFKESYSENGNQKFRYFINIRPECDIARNPKAELYCLKGRIVDETKINSGEPTSIIFQKGNFIEKINSTYVLCIDDGKIIEFFLKDLKIKKWNEIKSKRIGRLLPPYITKIQQKYSFYLQRQGLPGIPNEVIENNL